MMVSKSNLDLLLGKDLDYSTCISIWFKCSGMSVKGCAESHTLTNIMGQFYGVELDLKSKF